MKNLPRLSITERKKVGLKCKENDNFRSIIAKLYMFTKEVFLNVFFILPVRGLKLIFFYVTRRNLWTGLQNGNYNISGGLGNDKISI